MEWYAPAFGRAFNAEIDLDDNMTVTLHTSGYALDRFAHDYVNDLTNELATAAGYTVGGVSVGVVTRTLTVANSWALQRPASTAVALGDVYRPAAANGFLYRVVVAGTTGAGLPTYPTVIGQTVTDGTATWVCYGRAITVFQCTTAPSWGTATFTGVRYAVLSDRTSGGGASTQPLIAVTDFVTDQSGGGGTFQLNPHASLGNFHIAHH